MNYQVKGISGHQWVCEGGASGAGVCRVVQVCAGVRRCAQACMGVARCAHVCRMNFQNFFQRIESLHQRTLIRILYEFFPQKPTV